MKYQGLGLKYRFEVSGEVFEISGEVFEVSEGLNLGLAGTQV